ncbi:recombinase family protein [Paenibacillus larvae]|uniref:recombinase family protein n=1 Tax=Paenibacillus larvae TaxID=1464 RepID=UPI0001694CB1|nr:recombinase family protein [Paenibacillus larvae]
MKNKIAIYVRVSTTKESQKDSPEHQKWACIEHCKQIDLDTADLIIYEDRDTGTSIVARPQIQEMISDAQKGLFNTILFSSLSRFSRDALDSISLKRIFVNALGIRVISIEDFYDSQIEDNEMLFGIVSVVNQKLSEQISVASKRGIKQSAAKGNFIGNIAPYGYQKVNIEGRKTLIVDIEKAKVVREIFDLYVNKKMGEKEITKHLNENAIPSAKGGTWGITSVQRILQNEIYTGYNVYGKYEIKKVYTNLKNIGDRKRKLVKKDQELWQKSEKRTHPEIISQELYKKAQEIRQIRGGGKRGGRRKYVNVFAKIIYCKHCGSAMVTASCKKSDKYRYLICSKRRRHGASGCPNDKWIPYYDFRDEVISWVVEKLKKMINSETGSEYSINFVSSINQNIGKEIDKINKLIESNRRLLFELRKSKIVGEIDEKQYGFEKEEYEKEILQLEEKVIKLTENERHDKDFEKIRKEIKQSVDELVTMGNYDDVEKTRIILSRLIQRIVVDSDGQIDVITPLGVIKD